MTRSARLALGTQAAQSAVLPVGAWSAAGELPSPRRWFGPSEGMAVLVDGAVLVAGGATAGDAPTGESLLFDPAAGVWTATGALGSARHSHSTTRLADGRVLVAGGLTGTPPGGLVRLASTEVYDPATRSWSRSGDMGTARSLHCATRLPDGRVLVTGGRGDRSPHALRRSLASAELFDPGTGVWTPTAPMTDARLAHPAVLLQNGRVLVAGGEVDTGLDRGAGQAFCELYDPATGTWTPTGSLRTPRRHHQATLLADGTVLVTGGDGPGIRVEQAFSPFSQWRAERYNPATGAWTPGVNLPAGRSCHRAVALPSGQVLIVGGTDGATYDTGFSATALHDPAALTWTPAGGMATGRYSCSAVLLPDGRVLATGGTVRSGLADPAPGADLLTGTTEVFSF
ncbi:Kelch repeat-containing protein [Streptomyces vinaceus]|uniref:Kelch repeat-containing protein n=1 Tax=Streptomyces vinaceus TaxID=1960 RepID=UPI0038036C3A